MTIQQWAATKLGWSETSWDNNSFQPGNFCQETSHALSNNMNDANHTGTMVNFMGHASDRPFKGHEVDGEPARVSAHFLINRVLRYSIYTYACAPSPVLHSLPLACLPASHFLHGSH